MSNINDALNVVEGAGLLGALAWWTWGANRKTSQEELRTLVEVLRTKLDLQEQEIQQLKAELATTRGRNELLEKLVLQLGFTGTFSPPTTGTTSASSSSS